MQTMQAFHNWLFLESKEWDAYSEKLVQLTQSDPTKIADATGELGWKPWEAPANQVSN